MTDVIGPSPSFLLALPRSGSTLLSAMLDNHPAIASPPEPWILLALHALGRVDRRHPANAQLVGEAVAAVLDPVTALSVGRAAAWAVYDGTLKATGKTLFVDKTPRYHLILEYVEALFPQAPMIWLRRNPFDMVASYRTTWGIDVPALLRDGADDPSAFDLVPGLETLEQFHAARPDRVLALRYEDLVADPVRELDRVLVHLGVPAPDGGVGRLTDLSGLQRDSNRFGDPKIIATTAPHTRSVGGWQHLLSLDDVQVVLDAVGVERLHRLGYGAEAEQAMALGAVDRGPAVTEAHATRGRAQLSRRCGDIDSVTRLPHAAQGSP